MVNKIIVTESQLTKVIARLTNESETILGPGGTLKPTTPSGNPTYSVTAEPNLGSTNSYIHTGVTQAKDAEDSEVHVVSDNEPDVEHYLEEEEEMPEEWMDELEDETGVQRPMSYSPDLPDVEYSNSPAPTTTPTRTPTRTPTKTPTRPKRQDPFKVPDIKPGEEPAPKAGMDIKRRIRESIKELHEQNTTGVVWHRYRAYSNCNTPGGHATFNMPGGSGTWAQKVDDFYQTIGSPSPGTWIGSTGANSPFGGGAGLFMCWQYEGIFPQGQLMGFNDPSTISTYPDCTACENQVSTSGTTSGCDNTMVGSCAQTWLPSNMNWPNMVNFACTGNQTYSALEQSQLMGATNLLTQNGFTGTIPSFSNYQDISNFVNSTGIGQPQKGQIKRKLAKSHWGGCMFIDCNC